MNQAMKNYDYYQSETQEQAHQWDLFFGEI